MIQVTFAVNEKGILGLFRKLFKGKTFLSESRFCPQQSKHGTYYKHIAYRTLQQNRWGQNQTRVILNERTSWQE